MRDTMAREIAYNAEQCCQLKMAGGRDLDDVVSHLRDIDGVHDSWSRRPVQLETTYYDRHVRQSKHST